MFKFRDLKIGLFFLSFSLIFAFLLVPTIQEDWAHSSKGRIQSYTLGPRFFPYLAAGLMGLLSIMLIVQNLRPHKLKINEDKLPPRKNEFYPVLAFMSMGMAYIIILPFIGVPLATPLCLFCFFWYFGNRNLTWILLFAMGVTVFIYGVFEKLMGIPLPMGILNRLWTFS